MSPSVLPESAKDGVTVAKEVELPDQFENVGAQLLKQVALRTSELAGNGTTTATVLAQEIVREGAKAVAASINPMDIKRGIELAVNAFITDIRKRSRKVSSSEEIAQVRTISANDDAEIAQMLARAMRIAGNDGVITVEDAKSLETELDIVEGMQFDRGYISPSFVTNADQMLAELEDPDILIFERQLSNLQPLVPVLEKVVQ
jgi:chaperonin GroEL